MNKPTLWAAVALALVLAAAAGRGLLGEPGKPLATPPATAPAGGHLALPAPAPAVGPAPAVAASVASGDARAVPGAAAPTGIGSEGFGPHVQRALDSGDPRQALEAARWIASCRPDRDVESMINGSHPKYRLVLSADARADVITRERQNQRYCQTLTPDLMAQHQTLALRALDAKVPGAGLAYYDSLSLEQRSPAELALALRGLRADAEQGQEMAVPLLAVQALGQSRVEQLAYTKLMDLLVLKGALPPTTGLVLPKPPEPPYTAAEQADAASLVSRLWPRLKPPG